MDLSEEKLPFFLFDFLVILIVMLGLPNVRFEKRGNLSLSLGSLSHPFRGCQGRKKSRREVKFPALERVNRFKHYHYYYPIKNTQANLLKQNFTYYLK